ncbi:MAG: TIR protein [Osedax symbiont Rs1]|nr:MAG: TIR protein [Osedax symbiont Rs1]
MAKVVFSYSHTDEPLRNELEKHLSPLKRMGQIETWHDRRIDPGSEFESAIDLYFAEANIILLLVSPDFIASDYCYDIELKNALERHDRGDAIVIPVILRPCAWHNLPFGKLLAATTDGKPIVKFTHIDDGFVEVVKAVEKALDKVNGTSPPVIQKTPSISVAVETQQPATLNPRSGNLSIRKEFTDRDRDLACREGFDYVARFFENSLKELSLRNSEIETDFNLRDNDGFDCSIYLNGSSAARCGIWRGNRSHGMGDICYSNSGITHNSYNESMSVSDDGTSLGFKAMMGAMTGYSRDKLLTPEGMAEHLWQQFLQPLK